MWDLRIIEEDAVLELTRIPHHHAVPNDHIFAHVASASDLAILSNPRRPFQDCALLDDRPRANKDRVADERLSHQFAENRRLQPKLQVTRDLLQRVPDIFLGLEKLRMRRVFETEEFRRRKHFMMN
jgi:hypothetical protein